MAIEGNGTLLRLILRGLTFLIISLSLSSYKGDVSDMKFLLCSFIFNSSVSSELKLMFSLWFIALIYGEYFDFWSCFFKSNYNSSSDPSCSSSKLHESLSELLRSPPILWNLKLFSESKFLVCWPNILLVFSFFWLRFAFFYICSGS